MMVVGRQGVFLLTPIPKAVASGRRAVSRVQHIYCDGYAAFSPSIPPITMAGPLTDLMSLIFLLISLAISLAIIVPLTGE